MLSALRHVVSRAGSGGRALLHHHHQGTLLPSPPRLRAAAGNPPCRGFAVLETAAQPEPEQQPPPAPAKPEGGGGGGGKGKPRGRPRKPRGGSGGGGGAAASSGTLPSSPAHVQDVHPIHEDLVNEAAWVVLNGLRLAGFKAYLVGGAVRDLFREAVPKDFDIVSSANPSKLKKLFNTCYIVGRRFPVAHVHVKGDIVEVASFSTHTRAPHPQIEAAGNAESMRLRLAGVPSSLRRSSGGGRGGGGRAGGGAAPQRQGARGFGGTDLDWEMALHLNALKRDFTVNGLLYDPFTSVIHDFVGGLKDIEAKSIRTILPPDVSFAEDPARVLRALRLGARTGYQLEPKTTRAIRTHAALVQHLPFGRLCSELSIMLQYGASSPSVLLLAQHGVLDLVLPSHAGYLRWKGHSAKSTETDWLFASLAALDARSVPGEPANPAVCTAVLMAPLVYQRLAEAAHERASARARRKPRARAPAPAGDDAPPPPPPPEDDAHGWEGARRGEAGAGGEGGEGAGRTTEWPPLVEILDSDTGGLLSRTPGDWRGDMYEWAIDGTLADLTTWQPATPPAPPPQRGRPPKRPPPPPPGAAGGGEAGDGGGEQRPMLARAALTRDTLTQAAYILRSWAAGVGHTSFRHERREKARLVTEVLREGRAAVGKGAMLPPGLRL